MESLTCNNPGCPRRQGSRFNSERGLMQHLRKSPSCMDFQNRHIQSTNLCEPQMKKAKRSNDDTYTPIALQGHLERERQNPFYPVDDTDAGDFNGFCDNNATEAADDEGTINTNKQAKNDGASTEASTSFTLNQKCMCNLVVLMDSLSAPDYAVEKVIEWASSAQQAGWDFAPKAKSRKANIQWMYGMVNNSQQLLPNARTVEHDYGAPFECITYDFVPQLLALLQDRKLMQPHNLVLDMENPCSKYVSPDGCIGECHSGSVYQDLYDQVVTEPNQLLCPIIVYIDKSHIDNHSRFTLTPVTFTCSIFTEKARRYNTAWRPMGYMHEILTSSAHKKSAYNPGDTVRVYHKQMEIIMETFAKCEQRLKNVTLPIGPDGQMQVDILCPILFFITDNEEADRLAGRFKGHGPNIQRHCRNCDVSFEDLDNPEIECNRLEWDFIDKVAKSPDSKLRQKYSQHYVDNVFNRIHLASPKYGINGCTPPDIIHVVSSGPAQRICKIVTENLSNKNKTQLDQIAIHFHRTHRQSHRKSYPVTDFSRGITNLTQLTANENIGVIFVFVIISHFADGWKILQDAMSHNSETANVQDVVEIMEAFLCFHAWLKSDKLWPLDAAEEYMASAQASVRQLVHMFTTRLPRSQGNGWKLLKTHLFLHFVDEIRKFGVPKNFDTERPEHNHLHNVKHPGRRAHKCHESFERATAQRVSDTFIIDRTRRLINNDAEDDVPAIPEEQVPDSEADDIIRGTHHTIVQDSKNHKKYSVHWKTKADTSRLQLPKGLATFLCKHYKTSEVHLATEFRRGSIFCRCHPWYKDNGPQYDWVRVLYARGQLRPCRVLAVVPADKNGMHDNQLVVQCATKKTGVRSTLFTEWEVDPKYEIIDSDMVASSCFVLNIDNKNTLIAECLEYNAWASQFTAF